jgi:hypothetical protein
MNIMIENRIVGVIGPKGSGKTYRSARMFAKEKRAVLYQPVRVNTEADEFSTDIIETGRPEDLERVIGKEEFRCVYKVQDEEIVYVGKANRCVYTSAPVIFKSCYNVGSLTLYCDEAHKVLNQGMCDGEVSRVIELCRNNSLSITYMAQSMEVTREIRRNTDELYLYRLREPGDLEKIEERCGAVTAERVANLKRLRKEGGQIIPGECLHWVMEDA